MVIGFSRRGVVGDKSNLTPHPYKPRVRHPPRLGDFLAFITLSDKFYCGGGAPACSLLEEVEMTDLRIPRMLFFAILGAGVLQFAHDFPLLPERMASHFAASGAANGWMTKMQFLITYAVILLPAFFLEFWLHRRIAATPEKRLNLPNKDYWLAPERRAETFAYFEHFFAWYGCAFLLLELFAMGLAMRANFQSPPRMPTVPIVSAIVAFVVFNAIWIAGMLRRFSRIR
jgi:uncharacterized membrane protein